MRFKIKLISDKSMLERTITDYVVIDAEYGSGSNRKSWNFRDFRPLQIAAIRFKNGKIFGKSFNRVIIDSKSTQSDMFRAMKLSTSTLKTFQHDSRESHVYQDLHKWLMKLPIDIPIIIVGSYLEVQCIVDKIQFLVDNEKIFVKNSDKVRELFVYQFSDFIYSKFNSKMNRNFQLGLDSFDDVLTKCGLSNLIRSKSSHNAYDDCVLTNQLCQLLRHDTRFRLIFSRILNIRELIHQQESLISAIKRENDLLQQESDLYKNSNLK